MSVTRKVEGIKRTDPFVMWFVDMLVEHGEMKPSMYPIDTIVSEEQVTEENGQIVCGM